MTLIHIASGIKPRPSQSYLVDDFGDLCQLCACEELDYSVAASPSMVSSGTLNHVMRMLGE